jgi:hypothetical protein
MNIKYNNHMLFLPPTKKCLTRPEVTNAEERYPQFCPQDFRDPEFRFPAQGVRTALQGVG